MYYDIFRDISIQRKYSSWYFEGYKDSVIMGMVEQISSPAQEILNAAKGGVWQFDKYGDKTYLRECSTDKLFDFSYNSVFRNNYISIGNEQGNWIESSVFCTPFERDSICFALDKIKRKLKDEKTDKQRQKLIDDFKRWK